MECPAYVCRFCGKPFAHQPSLSRHEKSHRILPLLMCLKCNKRFSRRDHLRKHMKLGDCTSQATKAKNPKIENSFVCNTCGESFGRKSLRDRHLKKQHLEQQGETDNLETTKKQTSIRETGIEAALSYHQYPLQPTINEIHEISNPDKENKQPISNASPPEPLDNEEKKELELVEQPLSPVIGIDRIATMSSIFNSVEFSDSDMEERISDSVGEDDLLSSSEIPGFFHVTLDSLL